MKGFTYPNKLNDYLKILKGFKAPFERRNEQFERVINEVFLRPKIIRSEPLTNLIKPTLINQKILFIYLREVRKVND
jgi:hypothetical protein